MNCITNRRKIRISLTAINSETYQIRNETPPPKPQGGVSTCHHTTTMVTCVLRTAGTRSKTTSSHNQRFYNKNRLKEGKI